jgi:hypothetical protein
VDFVLLCMLVAFSAPIDSKPTSRHLLARVCLQSREHHVIAHPVQSLPGETTTIASKSFAIHSGKKHRRQLDYRDVCTESNLDPFADKGGALIFSGRVHAGVDNFGSTLQARSSCRF